MSIASTGQVLAISLLTGSLFMLLRAWFDRRDARRLRGFRDAWERAGLEDSARWRFRIGGACAGVAIVGWVVLWAVGRP